MRTWILIGVLAASLVLAPASAAGETSSPTSFVTLAWQWLSSVLGLKSEPEEPAEADTGAPQSQLEEDEPPNDEVGPLINPTG